MSWGWGLHTGKSLSISAVRKNPSVLTYVVPTFGRRNERSAKMEAFLTSDLAVAILSKLTSLAADELVRAWRLNDDLVSLKQRMDLARALLSDAETKPISMKTVQFWLSQLRDVVRDADDLLDKIRYGTLRRQVERRRKVHKYLSFLFSFKMARKIKHINTSLDAIYKKGYEIGLKPLEHILSVTAVSKVIQHTPPCVDESQIIGREEEIKKLVNELCSSKGETDLPIIAIVGMGGLGKTALAQMVYNNDHVKGHFEKSIWVTISYDFDVMRILNEMVQSLSGTNLHLSNLEALIKQIYKEVASKKLLLVLDDVWNEKQSEWDKLKGSLMGINSQNGSRIMITTRKLDVARIMGSSFIHLLKKLSFEHGWEIFKQKAFAIDGAVESEMFIAIGERMVKRCDGVPLAIKALGGLLYFKTRESEWLSIENSTDWGRTEVLPSLQTSFDQLQSSSLKNCFAYCSIFPKDFVMKKDQLIQLWMALDLLGDPDGVGSVEDTGECYFNILLWNSLFQDVEMDKLKNIVSCKMHDLVHDLASHVSKKYCSSVVTNKSNDARLAITHLRLAGVDVEKIVKFYDGSLGRLQTLYIEGDFSIDILKELKNLRVLVLSSFSIHHLPSSVGKLKYLRYIDLLNTSIETLPDSISKLHLLQTLRMHCLKGLPLMFEKLISLRHLHIQFIEGSIGCMFIGIRKLFCLQLLPFFVVSFARGCLLEELGGLDQLTLELSIYGLDDVKNLDDAKKAKLYRKSKIQSLRLYWAEMDERKVGNTSKEVGWKDDEINDGAIAVDGEQNEKDVLEGLQPHRNIKKLWIQNFKGKNLATWIVMLQNLVKIELVECNRCEEIPMLGHLPHLAVIWINGMSSLKCIGIEFYGIPACINSNVLSGDSSPVVCVVFPALRDLTLVNLPKLEEWMGPGEADDPLLPLNSSSIIFPCLEMLEICDCPVLKRIPGHFPSLKRLYTVGMNDSVALEKMSSGLTSLSTLVLKRIGGSKIQWVTEQLLRNNPSLTSVDIRICPQLKKLSTACLQFCTSLRSLTLLVCHSLDSVPNLQSLMMLAELSIGGFCLELDYFPWPYPSPSVTSLWLHGWGKLKSLPHELQYLSASLSKLEISGFGGLESLPEWLGSLSNLQKLNIWGCRKLRSVPSREAMRRLLKLNEFWIDGCPLLEKRCRLIDGTAQESIGHVFKLYIHGFQVEMDDWV